MISRGVSMIVALPVERFMRRLFDV